jgi:hypothetical protein
MRMAGARKSHALSRADPYEHALDRVVAGPHVAGDCYGGGYP